MILVDDKPGTTLAFTLCWEILDKLTGLILPFLNWCVSEATVKAYVEFCTFSSNQICNKSWMMSH